ncbi:MAG TPA: hypothetical protein VK718_11075 [Ferruginibacter sp.]|jgi:hypothetical protein|nr:hypothetical protein [Ferruginibacter sp.]
MKKVILAIVMVLGVTGFAMAQNTSGDANMPGPYHHHHHHHYHHYDHR